MEPLWESSSGLFNGSSNGTPLGVLKWSLQRLLKWDPSGSPQVVSSMVPQIKLVEGSRSGSLFIAHHPASREDDVLTI
jgi:hypothetical protein